MTRKFARELISFICLIFVQLSMVSVSVSAYSETETADFSEIDRVNRSIKANSSGTWIQGSDGRWWYKHSDGSYTKNGWEYIDGEWYHFDSQGWMQTGWLELSDGTYYLNWEGKMLHSGWYLLNRDKVINGHSYKVTELWNYFDSSGRLKTDSDAEGCSSGYNDFTHHKYYRGLSSLKYYVNPDVTSCASKCAGGFKIWKNKFSSISYTRSYNANNWDILFMSVKFENNNILAVTGVYDASKQYLGQSRYSTEDWVYGGIGINLESTDLLKDFTIAHELGHFFGLSHYVSRLDSIMQKYQFIDADNYGDLSPTDISTINHIYN